MMRSSNEKLATSFSSTDVLLHELQLGEQLNESVVQTRRADFSLMLAMLAAAFDHAVFGLLPAVRRHLVALHVEERYPRSGGVRETRVADVT